MSPPSSSSALPLAPLATPALPTPVLLTPALAAPALTAPAQKAKIASVAEQFEAIFLRQILAEARKSNFGDTLFASDAMDTFGAMADARFADIAAHKGTLGIARLLEKALAAKGKGAATGDAPDAAIAPITASQRGG